MQDIEKLKLPIGPFQLANFYTDSELQNFIKGIRDSSRQYREMTASLTEAELKKTYRNGSWTISQLVHHVADIQLLHYFRMKKSLTEPDYKEATLINMEAWAKIPENTPVILSLNLLQGMNEVFMDLASKLDEMQLKKQYHHPVRNMSFDQKQAIAISAWHLRHHLAHIELALS